MAGTKRERKLHRIERREQRMAAKVLAAMAGLGEAKEKAPCEKRDIFRYIRPDDHGSCGTCVDCEHKIPGGGGCKVLHAKWEDPTPQIPDAQWRKFKNWEFDKWKQRTRKQKRSCVA